MNAPNFYVLGAAKCGTTSLYYYLGQHPDVLFSEPKEPTFFEAEFEKGLEYYWSRYFSHWSGEAAVGEARVYNLYLPYVPERIHALTPEARLIAVLRHPVERAHSLWWHRFALRLEARSFEDAIEANRRRIEAGETFEGEAGARAWKRALYGKTTGTRIATYLDGGYYARQLLRYRALFPAERLRVVLLEDLKRDPAKVCADLWGFLGVTGDVALDATAQNEARSERRTRRSFLFSQLIEPLHLGRFVPQALIRRVRPLLAKGAPLAQPPLRPETRSALVEHYREHNRNLEELLGRDLSHWDR